MKHILLFLPLFLFSLAVQAQVPDSFTYQLVVRDAGGKAVKNDTVSIEVSIVSDSAMGHSQYSEVHFSTTTVSGLVTLVIGTGLNQNGNLSAIDWESRPYYLKIRIDTEGDTNYGSAMSMEMVSVPYALYSGEADTALDASYADTLAVSVSKEGDTLFLGTSGKYVVIPGLSEANPSLGCLQDTTEVVEVISTTGRIWMDRNLGAFQAANSSADSRAFGDYYQWGRGADGHQCRENDTTSTLASTVTSSPDSVWYGKFVADSDDWLSTPDSGLWQGVSGVNNPCPTDFRLPTISEWEEEIDAWSDKNSNGAFNSPLKLPVSGYRDESTGLIVYDGTNGYYWSSTVSSSRSSNQTFTANSAASFNEARANGYSVRCIKDILPITGCEADTTAVVEVVSAEGRIWMDRNLGALRAAKSSADSLAFGALYQWGRAADGHQCRNSDTTSTLANTPTSSMDQAWYGKFIVNADEPNDWLSPQDSNLWQGVNGVNNPCPTNFRLPTEAEWQTERESWSSLDSTGAFASPLKLPVAGNRGQNFGNFFAVGESGTYWSSTPTNSDAIYQTFGSFSGIYNFKRARGVSVRCIKELPPITGCESDTTAVVEEVSAEGRIWMDRNLGALRAAKSSADSLAFGALYQWGRAADGHQCRNSDTTSSLANTSTSSMDQTWYGKFIVNADEPNDWLSPQDSNLWQGVNGVNNPCPTGFRIPTRSEWAAEIDSWGSKDIMGAFNSPLKLTAAGFRNSLGNVVAVGRDGYYWIGQVTSSFAFNFRSDYGEIAADSRNRGHAVRCIKEPE